MAGNVQRRDYGWVGSAAKTYTSHQTIFGEEGPDGTAPLSGQGDARGGPQRYRSVISVN